MTLIKRNVIPVTANNFYIDLQLDGSSSTDGIFRSCSEFKFTQEVIEFREVTNQRWGNANKGRSRLTKIPGNIVGGNITLHRGLNISQCFWQWFSSVNNGNWFEQRKTMTITFRGDKNKAITEFVFTEAWPVNFQVGEAGVNQTEIEVNSIEIAYEGFEQLKV